MAWKAVHICIYSIFFSFVSYTEFIEKSNQLNDLENYPQLLERCKLIGYSVSKVVFRGYQASKALQEMHDNAIKIRTKLKMEVYIIFAFYLFSFLNSYFYWYTIWLVYLMPGHTICLQYSMVHVHHQ